MHPPHGGLVFRGIVSASFHRNIMGEAISGMGPDSQVPEGKMNMRHSMKTLIDRLKTAARNYARYTKTRNEIARLPLDVALDLGLYPGDADRIARKAVWN
jgi:uncharacterized protein YjiS (DUF1127 family)